MYSKKETIKLALRGVKEKREEGRGGETERSV